MLVSIVVPVYNVERYLRECLDSLRAQTLEDIEIVCVDDGSTDGSLAILREYEAEDPRFKVITKPNAGYGHTMNCGFAVARAPYIGILESDDFCKPDMCEKLYLLAAGNDLDLVRCDIDLYWSEPDERRKRARYCLSDGLREVFDPRDRPECFRLPPALCCMLVRKALVHDNGLFFSETPGASYQDTAFSFKLWACARRAMAVDDAYISYRQDNESSSINQRGKIQCVPSEYREIERFIASDEKRFSSLRPVVAARKFSAYIWNYRRIDEACHEEFARQMADELSQAQEDHLLNPDFYSSEEWSDLQLLLRDDKRFIERMDNWNDGAVRRFHLRSRIFRKIGMASLS
ncbi:glycosyltransferase family 2 protein [Eggerthella guodeyinii]|uniref:Glycosyltransferase family 2 protein n=1 Tax=Eggerthella guodeyinii TaxID=2690837 RepID=A0A6L7IXX3_9ACTN|nr:glycosyltransferase family 2 protein [Eggerthella guodeyinii]QOS67187.1 glycosyltransferase family 2 protein [Eggerthella guodeyinii]